MWLLFLTSQASGVVRGWIKFLQASSCPSSITWPAISSSWNTALSATPLCTASKRIDIIEKITCPRISQNSFVKENIMNNHTSIINLYNSKRLKTLTFDQPQADLQPLLFIESHLLRMFNDSTHGWFQDIHNDILAMLPSICQVVNYVTMNQLHFFKPWLGSRCRVAAQLPMKKAYMAWQGTVLMMLRCQHR